MNFVQTLSITEGRIFRVFAREICNVLCKSLTTKEGSRLAFGVPSQGNWKEKRNDMNWDQVEGKWKQVKGSAKQQWGKLTDDDLTYMGGKKDEIIGRIQERYGITREQAQKEADDWATALKAEADAQHGTASKI
jgi:uncharacterized protein YjbJ (UPF0337 family)